MIDAKLSSLSKIEVGQAILVVAGDRPKTFGYGRPKDPTAKWMTVKSKTFEPDDWTGKKWTVKLDDGRTSEHARYGTTHVYVPPVDVTVTETEVELQELNTWRRVTVKDGVMRVADWEGGDWTGETPHGKPIHITADGVVTVLVDGGERTPSIDPLDDDIADGERCNTCKGYGVVRKSGSKAGQPYRTANGAATASSSVKCPTCKGATLLVRAV